MVMATTCLFFTYVLISVFRFFHGFPTDRVSHSVFCARCLCWLTAGRIEKKRRRRCLSCWLTAGRLEKSGDSVRLVLPLLAPPSLCLRDPGPIVGGQLGRLVVEVLREPNPETASRTSAKRTPGWGTPGPRRRCPQVSQPRPGPASCQQKIVEVTPADSRWGRRRNGGDGVVSQARPGNVEVLGGHIPPLPHGPPPPPQPLHPELPVDLQVCVRPDRHAQHGP